MQNKESFIEMFREIEKEKEMPLRRLATLLDLDQSTLSKIERNDKSANSDFIEKIAKIFKVSKKDLLEEEFRVEALQVAEEK